MALKRIKYLYHLLFWVDMRIVMLGPPGSGKGTVSERLAEEFDLLHISVGALLRQEAKGKTSLGKEISRSVEKGELVSHELVVKIARKAIGKSEHFILDGFPRSLDQARAIEDLKIGLALYLDVPEKEVVKRLSGRRLDPVTGKTYQLDYLPPPKDILERLVQRKDDLPAVIKELFKVNREENEPGIGYYQKEKILATINGTGSPDEVYERVKKVVRLI